MMVAKIAAPILLLAACGLSTPTGPVPDQDGQVELRVGDEVTVPKTVVEEDSRCPVDMVCVWEGNAAVELGLTAGSGPTHLHVLNTALEPKAVDFSGVRVTLVGVAPEPREGQPIPEDEYVVTLRLESALP